MLGLQLQLGQLLVSGLKDGSSLCFGSKQVLSSEVLLLIGLAESNLRLLMLVVHALKVLNVLVQLRVLVLQLPASQLLLADLLLRPLNVLVLLVPGLAQVLNASGVGVDLLLERLQPGLELSVVELPDCDQVLESGDLLVVLVRHVHCVPVVVVQPLDLLPLLEDLAVQHVQLSPQLADLPVARGDLSVGLGNALQDGALLLLSEKG